MNTGKGTGDLNKAGRKESKGGAGQELERRILHGVALEWTHAVSHLTATPKSSLQMPLFSLRDLNGQWGMWSRSKREISLSRRLVLNHSWDSVREVVLHEIAHQYVDEVFGAHNEPPHGALFQKACHLLRANPKSSGSYPPSGRTCSI